MLWIFVVIGVAIVIGWSRGGRLRNLTEIRVRIWWLLVAGFALQTVAIFLPSNRHGLAVALILASYVPLLLFVWLNRAMAGMWIAGIGILMNFSVIALNGGMPVLLEAVRMAGGTGVPELSARHVLMSEATRLPFLADVIPLPANVISLGDVFLAIGIGIFVEDRMRRPIPLFARGVQSTPGSAASR
ncbi:MAG: hypothetical protein BMS9Abin07_1366 [Acidimicrobiia bacterium]|nr:MAG: hypothetical protein BMS9Abin07_1366 [Acidimicrobiia bacterium]